MYIYIFFFRFFSSISYSIQFSRSVISDSLRPHGLRHARPLCQSPAPGTCSNSCSWSEWCHPTISSSVVPFSSYLQSFPASGSFPNRWLFTSGGQSIGASVSASVLTMNIQGWFPLGLTGLISMLFKGLSRVFTSAANAQPSLWSNTNMTTRKTIAFLGYRCIICIWLGDAESSSFWIYVSI